MQELDDISLLREYVERRSEEAFATLVTRHVNKVYSVALRHTRNPHQAEEITQAVFALLAKKSRHFSRRVVLSGWLYQAARRTALTFIRSESRRTHREHKAHMQTVLNETESDPWPQIAPLLDAAMAGLNETDRHAVVLRFFDGCSMREVGAGLGANEDAARKRVNRAVEKLRLFFTKRGVVFPAGVLTAAISANSVQAAPIGLAKAISVAAITQGATAGASIIGLIKGLLKPILTSSAGMFAAPLVSGFFTLKAEIEHTKSPRERQFIVRMIWLRFAVAFLAVAVGLGAMTLPIMKQPQAIVFGFAGWCFCGAIESAARIVYFHRRRRQIQIEDGTWEEFDSGKPAKPAELLSGLSDKTSKANSYAARAAVFGLLGCAIITATLVPRLMSGGHWIAALFVLLWGGFASFRWIRNWRKISRFVFDPKLITPVKVVVYFGVLTLLLFDSVWARGRLPQSTEWAIGFNFAVVLVYAALIKVFARLHLTHHQTL